MKRLFTNNKTAVIVTYLLFSLPTGWSQTTILSENIGTPSGTVTIGAHTFQNSGTYTYTGSSDVRNTTVSSGYTGASGGGNVFITSTVGKDFVISGINTMGYTSLVLSFGHFKSTNASSNELVVEVSTDGTTYSALSYTRPTGGGTSNWLLVTPSGTIPSTSTLSIRFRQTSATPQFRIDDILLTGIAPLGVKWSFFTGEASEGEIDLSWGTETEENSDRFAVERGDANGNFTEIGSVASTGNSTAPVQYAFVDRHPQQGLNYYRLRQIDHDGAYAYSTIITFDNENAADLGVHYLQAQQQLVFSKTLRAGSTVAIYQASGQRVEAITVTDAQTSVPLYLATGIWMVRVQQPGGHVLFSRFAVY